MNRLTDIQEIWDYLKLVYEHLKNVSRKSKNDSSYRTEDIHIYPNSGDRHKRNLKSFGTSEHTSKECVQNISEI